MFEEKSPYGNEIKPCPDGHSEEFRRGWEDLFDGVHLTDEQYAAKDEYLAGYNAADEADADMEDVTPSKQEGGNHVS